MGFYFYKSLKETPITQKPSNISMANFYNGKI